MVPSVHGAEIVTNIQKGKRLWLPRANVCHFITPERPRVLVHCMLLFSTCFLLLALPRVFHYSQISR
jgi:hypothetical protein